jgi:hypothetical protein
MKVVCISNRGLSDITKDQYGNTQYYPDYSKLKVGSVYEAQLAYVFGDGSSGCCGYPNGEYTEPCGSFIADVSRSINENYDLKNFLLLRDFNLNKLIEDHL